MKKAFLLLIFFAAMYVSVIQAQVTFCKTIGGARDDAGNAIVKTRDHGFAIAGISTNLNAVISYVGIDAYLVKLDSAFNPEWANSIRNSDPTNSGTAFNSVIQDNNGDYVAAGSISAFGSNSPLFPYIYVTKSDSSGNLLWAKAILTAGFTLGSSGSSIVEANGGGYLVTGYFFNADSGDYDIPLIKLDNNGNIEWSKIIGARGNDDFGYAIIKTSDGGYAIGGSTSSFGAGYSDYYLVKLDSSINLQWTKTIGGIDADQGRCLVQTKDGGYAMAGGGRSFGVPGGYDFYIVKTDSSGNLQWGKAVGKIGEEMANSIFQSDDGGFIAAGYSMPSLGGYSDMYIVKLDSNGILQWIKTAGDTLSDHANAVTQLDDKSFIIVGEVNQNFGDEISDIWMIKLDSAGNGCCVTTVAGAEHSGGITGSGGIIDTLSFYTFSDGVTETRGALNTICFTTGMNELVENHFETIVFMSDDILHLKFVSVKPGRYSIQVFTVLGQKILGDEHTITTGSRVEFTYNTSTFKNGIYFVRIQSESDISVHKILVK